MIVFLLLSLAGFIASVIVHASSFSATAPIGMHNAWPLHIGIFVLFLPMALLQQRQKRPARVSDANAGTSDELPRRHTPRWMRWVTGACLAYAIASLLLFTGGAMLHEREGTIATVDGRHVLRSHGEVVRPVSEEEFRAHDARVARRVSPYWIVFYWVSFVGIYDGLSRRREARLSMPRLPALPETLRQAHSYERAPTPRLSPWLHATTGAVLSLLCFFAVPLALKLSLGRLVGPAARHSAGGGWFFLVAPLFFGAAILGFTLPGRLMARYVPAACPTCGGHAHASGAALGNNDEGLHYTCHDCGHTCGVDGVRVA